MIGEVDAVLVRYGELATKGGNRHEFEAVLSRNIVRATAPISPVTIERLRGRLVVRPERRIERVARRLQDVFGISSVSPARSVETDLDSVKAAAEIEVAGALELFPSDRTVRFRVSTRRADKRFPMRSTEIDRDVADHVMPGREDRLRVDLANPELELEIDLRDRGTYVFARRYPGPGGLPVGSLGRAVCLLSGGIDSPVAAWLTMKRGALVRFVSFHSAPYLGEGSKEKIRRLVRRLAHFQPRSFLFSLPFARIQEAIRDGAPEGYRTILYRRQMQRLASAVAHRERAGCLVTGESLGQVASQTMENLRCIEAASTLPVLRPLITFDKQETIDLANRIGTFETSIEPEPDCCTVFMPRKPVIRGRVDLCERVEEELELEPLREEALASAERTELTP